jgi:hypothetical protein
MSKVYTSLAREFRPESGLQKMAAQIADSLTKARSQSLDAVHSGWIVTSATALSGS